MGRKEADIESMDEYQRLIRCHPDHGNNFPILRACGYVMDMESSLVRPGNAKVV